MAPGSSAVTHEVRAEAKYVRTAPRKAQLVVSEIRGLRATDARTVLAFMPRDAARDVEAVLASAIANAEANHGLFGEDLYVSAAYVGSGPTLKRWRARARGRVGRIKKRTCHITIRLAPLEGVQPRVPADEKRGRARRANVETSARESAAPEAGTVDAPAVGAPESVADASSEEKPKRTPRRRAAEPVEPEGAKPAETEPASPKAKPAKAGKADAGPAAAAPEKPKGSPRKKVEPEGNKEE